MHAQIFYCSKWYQFPSERRASMYVRWLEINYDCTAFIDLFSVDYGRHDWGRGIYKLFTTMGSLD